jgi:phage nucleotide-binding protein
MPLKLKSTKDFKAEGCNILAYGESGVGKTTLCATADAPLIISAEGGLRSLSNYDLPVFEIKSRKDCDEVYDWLESSKEANKYNIICIDSLSEIAEVLLSDEKKRTKDARQAYGVMNDEMAILIRGFRDLPRHIYFSCKLKKVVDESTGATYYMPAVPGNTVLQSLPYFFDEVLAMKFGKLDDGEIYRYLQTQGDLQWVAKDRSNNLDKVVEPNLQKLIDTIVS